MSRTANVDTKENGDAEAIKKHNAALVASKPMTEAERVRFDKDFENGITVEEFHQRMVVAINSFPWKK